MGTGKNYLEPSAGILPVIQTYSLATDMVSGDDLLASTVDTSATDDTVTTPTLTSTVADLCLSAGDRLAAEWGGTVTNGVAATVNVVLTPTGGTAVWE